MLAIAASCSSAVTSSHPGISPKPASSLTESDLTELLDALRAGGNIDVTRRGVELVLQALIESELTAEIGAQPHERAESRSNQRNGHRPRVLSNKAGDVELAIPY